MPQAGKARGNITTRQNRDQRAWIQWLMNIPIENATDTPEIHKAAFCSVRFPLLRLILRIAQTSMAIANNGNT